MTTVSVSEARANFRDLLEQVERGSDITITRHGEPIAIVVSPTSLPHRRAAAAHQSAERIREMLSEAGRQPIPEGGLSQGRADELVEQLRRDRDVG